MTRRTRDASIGVTSPARHGACRSGAAPTKAPDVTTLADRTVAPVVTTPGRAGSVGSPRQVVGRLRICLAQVDCAVADPAWPSRRTRRRAPETEGRRAACTRWS